MNAEHGGEATTTTAGPEHGVNVPLLRTVLEVATRHPEKHNQKMYARRNECGTAYCLAGMTAVITRQRLDWWRDLNDYTGDAEELADGGTSIDGYAAETLGLPSTLQQAQRAAWREKSDVRHLFAPDNDLPTCWEIASEITNGEIEVPADLQSGR